MHLKQTHTRTKQRVKRSIEQNRKQKNTYLTLIVTKFKHSYIQQQQETQNEKQKTKNVHTYMHFHYLINSYRTTYVRETRKSVAKQKRKHRN